MRGRDALRSLLVLVGLIVLGRAVDLATPWRGVPHGSDGFTAFGIVLPAVGGLSLVVAGVTTVDAGDPVFGPRQRRLLRFGGSLFFLVVPTGLLLWGGGLTTQAILTAGFGAVSGGVAVLVACCWQAGEAVLRYWDRVS